MSNHIYESVTADVLECLEQGTAPWRKPWRGTDAPRNAVTGHAYRGINILLTAIARESKGFESCSWLTFRQAKARGARVRRGSKGTQIVFWKRISVTDRNQPERRKAIPLLKNYYVFNTEQVDGLDLPGSSETTEIETVPTADSIIEGYTGGPDVTYGGDVASYLPSSDAVSMPPLSDFESASGFYSTLFHELAHSTGHRSRLARVGVINPASYGSHAYSREELVAEMGSAFLLALCGLEVEALENQAAYVAGWKRALSGDDRAVVIAAAQAQRAADWIIGRRFERGEGS